MLSTRYKILSLLVVAALLLTACGGGDESKSEAKPTATAKQKAAEPTKEPAPTAEPEQLDPTALGEKIGALYLESIQTVNELVKDKPPAAEVEAQVAELKEAYVQQLVALGHQREALERLDRAAVDNAINKTFIAGSKTDWYDTYFEAVQYYFDEDYEFQQLLYSFNIIGQYANFDLLRKQEPEEAARLGIAAESAAADAPPPTTAPEPTTAAETAQGEEMRSEQGGYSFQPVPGFTVQEISANVVMTPDGGDPEYGPAVIIVGGANEGHASPEALLDSLLKDADDAQLSNRREISVGGVPGIAIDLKSQGDGEVEVTSRMVVALGSANQQFTMFGFAPTEQWAGLEPLFEGVLASIRFFEPSAGPTPAPATTLGEEQRNAYGGFTFQTIQGYELAEELGMIGIFAPDGDLDIGPGILILSLFDEEVVGLEPLVDALTTDAPNIQVSEQRKVTVGGVEGVAVDLSGTDAEGRAIVSRVVVALPEPTRQFTMIGIAPPERWDGELEPLFEGVLASVSFFEPSTESEGE